MAAEIEVVSLQPDLSHSALEIGPGLPALHKAKLRVAATLSRYARGEEGTLRIGWVAPQPINVAERDHGPITNEASVADLDNAVRAEALVRATADGLVQLDRGRQ